MFDAHSRRILGWRAATSMTTPLVLDCLDMALWTRRREGVAGFAGLTHHTDAGSVYTSIAFTDRLIDEGIDASVGSVGDAYDNSLSESKIGLFKSELIHHEGPWRDIDQVEAATASWALWFNTERTRGSIDDLTPLEVEQLDYAHTEPVESRLTPAIRSPNMPGRVTLVDADQLVGASAAASLVTGCLDLIDSSWRWPSFWGFIQSQTESNGSTVRCEDGTWSTSGGVQGACSWHGGVGD